MNDGVLHEHTVLTLLVISHQTFLCLCFFLHWFEGGGAHLKNVMSPTAHQSEFS